MVRKNIACACVHKVLLVFAAEDLLSHGVHKSSFCLCTEGFSHILVTINRSLRVRFRRICIGSVNISNGPEGLHKDLRVCADLQAFIRVCTVARTGEDLQKPASTRKVPCIVAAHLF